MVYLIGRKKSTTIFGQ